MAKSKLSKSALKNKCDKLASDHYRAETPYCELAGKDTISCGGILNWMHIFSRSNMRLRYEPNNKLVGCQGHHVFYTYNPIQWTRFLEKHYPERLTWSEEHANEYVKVTETWLLEWADRFKQKVRDV